MITTINPTINIKNMYPPKLPPQIPPQEPQQGDKKPKLVDFEAVDSASNKLR